MLSPKALLMISAVLTAILLITAILLLRQQRDAPLEASATPDVESIPADRPGSSLAQAGVRALEAGDTQAAIRLFERALEKSPANDEWRLWLERAELELEAERRRAGARVPEETEPSVTSSPAAPPPAPPESGDAAAPQTQ